MANKTNNKQSAGLRVGQIYRLNLDKNIKWVGIHKITTPQLHKTETTNYYQLALEQPGILDSAISVRSIKRLYWVLSETDQVRPDTTHLLPARTLELDFGILEVRYEA